MGLIVENFAENPFHYPRIDHVTREGDKTGNTMPVTAHEIVFPGCRPGKDEHGKDAMIPGRTEITEEQLAAMKSDKAMKTWFGNGKLQVVDAPAKAKAAQKQ